MTGRACRHAMLSQGSFCRCCEEEEGESGQRRQQEGRQEQGSHLIQNQDEGAAGLPGTNSPLLHRLLQEELSLVGLRRAEAEGQGLQVAGG